MKVIVINSKKYGTHEVLVDDDDYEMVMKYKWHVKYCKYKHSIAYYAITNIYNNDKKTTKRMHVMIMKSNYLNKEEVDHKDRNGLNN